MFTKQEVDYLVDLIERDVKAGKDIRSRNAPVVMANGETVDMNRIREEVGWRVETAPKLILMLKQHRGSILNSDEKTYLMKLLVEHRLRLSDEVEYAVYKENEVDEVVKEFENWFRLGAPAAIKFQDRFQPHLN